MFKKALAGIFIIILIISLAVSVWYIQKQPKKYAGPVEKITLAAYEGAEGSLVYLVEEQGFFEKNGLEVEIKHYEAGKLAGDALLKGDVDISTSADTVFVSNAFDRDDLRVLGTIAESNSLALIARKDRAILTPSDLEGRKIGVTKKSVGEFYLGTFLIFNHLSLDDVEVVDLTPSEIIQALVDGDIDAGFTWEPNITKAKELLGDNAISWPGQSGQDYFFIIMTTEDWISRNKDTAKRFLKSLIEAEDYFKDSKVEAKKFLDERFDHEGLYADIVWTQHNFAVKLPQSMLLQFEDIARWRIKNKLTDATEVPNYLDYIYLDALEAVKPEAVTIIH